MAGVGHLHSDSDGSVLRAPGRRHKVGLLYGEGVAPFLDANPAVKTLVLQTFEELKAAGEWPPLSLELLDDPETGRDQIFINVARSAGDRNDIYHRWIDFAMEWHRKHTLEDRLMIGFGFDYE